MKHILLFLVFVLCILLPFLFRLLEGMEYSTEIHDTGVHYTTAPEDRILLDLKDSSGNQLPTN
jgi:hypothetical protein